MELNAFQYLHNPYGKGAAGNFEPLKQAYLKEYAEKKDKIKYSIYTFKTAVIYHIIIPSSKSSDVTYDVVLEFDTRNLVNNSTSIMESPVKVFTNVPSFVYTYANVFYKYKLICKWLLEKYSKETLKHMPEIRNQYKIIGPEKYLYLAMHYMKDTTIEKLDVITNTSRKVYSYSYIAHYIRTEQEILLKRKPSSVEKVKDEDDAKRIIDKHDTKSKNRSRKRDDINLSKSPNNLNRTGRSKSISKTKGVNKTTKIKRI